MTLTCPVAHSHNVLSADAVLEIIIGFIERCPLLSNIKSRTNKNPIFSNIRRGYLDDLPSAVSRASCKC
jgi:hypothetical protein